jgi:hypothetical protein
MKVTANQYKALADGYPRPQLRRKNWMSLNGWWDFSIDKQANFKMSTVPWDAKILIPFSPETKKSAIHNTGYYKACWYRRDFTIGSLKEHERVILHFGAVDHRATVWINGQYAGSHIGGYTPFSIDVTLFLIDSNDHQTIVVRAYDDPLDLQKPRGKQDWQLHPHSIWYPRTTGIWQTVWIEVVHSTRISEICWIPSLIRWELGFEAWLQGATEGCRLRLSIKCHGRILAQDEYVICSHEVHRRIALSDPGIDDYRNEILWSPESPTLIDATVELLLPSGEVVDHIETYTALRTVTVEGNRFVLNGRPYYLRMILDQGYWENTGMTFPSEEAIIKDIELIKAMGFNGVRKHQKIESPRFLFWADCLGLLVWEEMPSAYRFTQFAVKSVTEEWGDVIRRDISHPCIVAWVPFNESWGVPNLPDNPVHQNYVRALYYLTKTLDSTRLVVGNDGWESVATDIIGIHDYDASPDRIAHRYKGDTLLPHFLKQERPGGRSLIVGNQESSQDNAIVLSEFGGIAFSKTKNYTWGYSRSRSPEELAKNFEDLMDAVYSIGLLTGFCYTQFVDTYQEANGLLFINRKPKCNIKRIRKAVTHSDRR